MKIPLDTAAEVLRYVQGVIEKEISDAFKFVLENKHLYQNYDIPVPTFDNIVKTASHSSNIRIANEKYNEYLKFRWDDIKNVASQPLTGDVIRYTLPTAKMYCSTATCKRVEPFNPMRSFDIFNTSSSEYYNIYKEQLFLTIYQCQSCKRLPEVFLIRRKGWKLNIAGRNPIETIQTKTDIPKEFATYISNAKLAFNSGQTLAGLFFLRVFIEQYTNKVIGEKSLMVDEIIKKYMEGLPNDFKERQPSLAKTYEDLSAAIHNADSNEELFSKSLDDIERHFEAKRIYKV